MVIGRLAGYLGIAFVGAYLLNTLIRPVEALGTASALVETGSGIASIGEGIGSSLRSIGSGSAKLLDPLFSLKDLLYDSRVPGSANVSATAQNSGSLNPSNSSSPSSSTITWSSGTTATVPSLSPQARAYYSALGVKTT
jgi:hypothetical protein|tara:strand:+ start:59 stop:475 length:417 start_codon:yes stop_codon:yes gene_type:complete